MSDIIIGKHTLESLTSGMYADPFVVFREYIQNAVDSIDDAYSKGILKEGEEQISVLLKPLEQTIVIADNGTGIPTNEAEKTLISIGNSKKSFVKSRGFRGIGRLSALSYCSQLIFETSYKGESTMTRISVDSAKLAKILSEYNEDDVSVVDVLERVYTVTRIAEKDSRHYFRVVLEGVSTESKLISYDDVFDYISQNAPVPYDPRSFAWGKEITNRIKALGYEINSYNISVVYGTSTKRVFKPYKDRFVVEKSKEVHDTIKNIEIIKLPDINGGIGVVGWLAETSYLGSIYDRTIKGIRFRKGNILVGDAQTAGAAFKDTRFNGWSIGELFAIDAQLLPNARRDNFEKNAAYYTMFEQLSNIAFDITKKIRTASIQRNATLAKAVDAAKAAEKKTSEIDATSSSYQRGEASKQVQKAQELVGKLGEEVSSADSFSGIAFDELDMLIGTLKGATKYKVLNMNNKLTGTEKRVLEKVFDVISLSEEISKDSLIEKIAASFK